MAFYLKYRPQKLADLDLAEVREGLIKALSSKEISHAFLFAGPRGTGKTSAARIVAKAVNCQKGEASQGNTSDGDPKGLLRGEGIGERIEPCNSCDFCLSITAGTNLDVLEIDAASNRGIDDIRSLREKIKLAPVKARYKVYIIDEAHMLTSEAFNALLKTLEEPPPHAIFILCTTEPHKLPPTIVSRCLRFNFRKAKLDELMAGLEKIVKAEKLKVEKGVLEKIAGAADGSFRDSQKILEQVSFEKGEITVKRVNEVLGQVREAGPEKLLEYLVEKDARGAILEIGRVVEQGVNLWWYSEELLKLLRLGLLAKFGVEVPGELNTEAPAFAKASAGKLKIEEIKNLIEIFSRAAVELKTAIISQLPLEMAVIEFCTLTTHPRPTRLQSPKATAFGGQATHNLPSPQDFAPSSPSNPSFGFICEKWPEIVKEVGPKNHSVQAFLRAARPKDFDGENLVLEVFYEFHKTQLESDKCRRLVEETIAMILEMPVKIKCVLGQKPSPKSQAGGENQSDNYRLDLSRESQESNQGSDFSDVSDSDIMTIAEEIFGKTVD